MDPKQLSEELRQGQNPHMTRRRWIYRLIYAWEFDGTSGHTVPDWDR